MTDELCRWGYLAAALLLGLAEGACEIARWASYGGAR